MQTMYCKPQKVTFALRTIDKTFSHLLLLCTAQVIYFHMELHQQPSQLASQYTTSQNNNLMFTEMTGLVVAWKEEEPRLFCILMVIWMNVIMTQTWPHVKRYLSNPHIQYMMCIAFVWLYVLCLTLKPFPWVPWGADHTHWPSPGGGI